MDPADPTPKRRPRVSLLSLFLLIALVSTSIMTIQLWREVGPLRAEVSAYRAELGLLDDDLPELFSAIRLVTDDIPGRREWAWRFRPPANSNYQLKVAEGLIPLDEFPLPSLGIPLLPELEHVVRVVASEDAATGVWTVSLGWRREDGRVHQNVLKQRLDWGDEEIDVLFGVNFVTNHLPIDRPSVLAKIRSERVDPDPAPGVMLWVDP